MNGSKFLTYLASFLLLAVLFTSYLALVNYNYGLNQIKGT